MFELPTTEEHFQKLQAEFNRRLFSVYDDAKEIVEERAKQYDTQRPVWERVSFPQGFMHEVGKKMGRIKAQIDNGEKCMVPKSWAHTREDILDAANYLLFMAVYGDMLHDEMFPTKSSIDDYIKKDPYQTTREVIARCEQSTSLKEPASPIGKDFSKDSDSVDKSPYQMVKEAIAEQTHGEPPMATEDTSETIEKVLEDAPTNPNARNPTRY